MRPSYGSIVMLSEITPVLGIVTFEKALYASLLVLLLILSINKQAAYLPLNVLTVLTLNSMYDSECVQADSHRNR